MHDGVMLLLDRLQSTADEPASFAGLLLCAIPAGGSAIQAAAAAALASGFKGMEQKLKTTADPSVFGQLQAPMQVGVAGLG
jgi:hypothetical protein